MIRAIPTGILRQGLLVIAGAEGNYHKEIVPLRRRGRSTGRLLIDVAVVPPVDQANVGFRASQFGSAIPFVGASLQLVREVSSLRFVPAATLAHATLPSPGATKPRTNSLPLHTQRAPTQQRSFLPEESPKHLTHYCLRRRAIGGLQGEALRQRHDGARKFP
jgi:hypothetical protein